MRVLAFWPNEEGIECFIGLASIDLNPVDDATAMARMNSMIGTVKA